MKVAPLRWYREPAYPTADELRERPELLERRPSRWLGRGAASLVTAVLGVSGVRCGGSMPLLAGPEPTAPEPAPPPEPAAPADAGPAEGVGSPDGSPPAEASGEGGAATPPVEGAAVSFEVGRGRAAMGCVVIAPPVFLTEDEAWEAISSELAAAGLSPSRGGPTVPDLTMPMYRVERPVPLELDGGDSGRHVGVEFLSRGDLEALERIGEGQAPPGTPILRSSVQSYRFLDAAREMAAQLGRPESLIVGVFYDPATCACIGSYCRPDLGCEPDQARARAKSLDDLRAQVRQFVGFLRTAGAI